MTDYLRDELLSDLRDFPGDPTLFNDRELIGLWRLWNAANPLNIDPEGWLVRSLHLLFVSKGHAPPLTHNLKDLIGFIGGMMPACDLPWAGTPVDATPTPANLIGDQPAAYRAINGWLQGSDPAFVLKGVAGTGKTTLMQQFKGLQFTAPTNKAAQVLASHVGEACTTHSFFGLRLEVDGDQQVLKPSGDVKARPGQVVVIDECSMLGTELLETIMGQARDLGLRLLFVGDPAQLNPVGQPRSPVWGLQSPGFFMKKILRNQDELPRLAATVRQAIKEKNRHPDLAPGQQVQLVGHKQLEQDIGCLKLEDYDSTRILAWRNKTVHRYNELARQALGFTGFAQSGERMVLMGPVIRGRQVVANTSDEFTVVKVQRVNHTLPSGHVEECHELTVTGLGVSQLWVPTAPASFDQHLSKLSKAAYGHRRGSKQFKEAWQGFFREKEAVASVDYAYAMTIHKSQGSTYQRVLLDVSDVKANKNTREMLRCLYVGVTRPQQHLTLAQ